MDMHIGRIAPAHIECKFIKVSTHITQMNTYQYSTAFARLDDTLHHCLKELILGV
jgi:hypothetical protein